MQQARFGLTGRTARIPQEEVVVKKSGRKRIALATGLAIVFMLVSSAAYAKNKVYRGDEALFQLELCRSMVDKDNPKDQIANDRIANSCCSEEYGYCIECPKATPDSCTRYPYLRHSALPIAPRNDVVAPTDNDIRSLKRRFNSSGGVLAR